MRITASDPVLAVHDLDISANWYRNVLGCDSEDVDPGNWRFCRAGDVTFMLGRCPGVPTASELGDHSYVAMAPGSCWPKSVAARDHVPMTIATIAVRVQTRSRRDEVLAVRDGVVVVRVTAPPLDGRANEALRRVLADRLGVPVASVSIVRGQRSRDKLVRVDGIEPAAVDAALGL